MARRRTPASTVDTTLADRLPIRSFDLNGKSFVSGLLWETLESSRSYMKEARTKGRALGMDIVAIRKGVDPRGRSKAARLQAGYAPKGRGVTKGMYSLAAVLAARLGNNWIGAFRIADDLYALVGVADGNIVPGCDLVADQATIQNTLLEQHSHLTGANIEFDAVYSPPEFNYSNDHADLSDLLDPKKLKDEYRLKPLTFGLSRRELFQIAGVAAAILVAVAGYSVYSANQERLREEEAAAQARARALAASQQASEEAAIPIPWASVPAPSATLARCDAIADRLPLALAGWIFDNGKCAANGDAIATYKRTGRSTVNQVRSAGQQRFGAEPAFFDNGETAAFMFNAPDLPNRDEQAPPASLAINRFMSHLQGVGIRAPLDKQPAPGPPPGSDPTLFVPPHWETYFFTFDTELPPSVLFGGLDDTGLRIREVATRLDPNTASLTWTITGVLYVQ